MNSIRYYGALFWYTPIALIYLLFFDKPLGLVLMTIGYLCGYFYTLTAGYFLQNDPIGEWNE